MRISNRRMRNKPVRRNDFTIEKIIDSLVDHPFFEKDKTVLSIGTSSTEPFARGEVPLVLQHKFLLR